MIPVRSPFPGLRPAALASSGLLAFSVGVVVPPSPAVGAGVRASGPMVVGMAVTPAAAPGRRAARPRAQVSATTSLDPTGRLVVALTSDARRVRLTYSTRKGNRAKVIKLAAGAPVSVTLPATARQVRARALAQRGLRASVRIAIAAPSPWKGAPIGIAALPIQNVANWAYSPDGGQVGFLSRDAGPPAPVGAPPGATGALYVADIATGTQRLVSADAAGAPAVHNDQPASVLTWAWLPGSGQVAFSSDATNLVPGVVDGAPHAYLKDLATGAVSLVSTPLGDAYPLDGLPAWSADGRHLAFAWVWPCPGGSLPRRGVMVADLTTGLVTPVVPAPACGASTASPDRIEVAGISASGLRVLVRRPQPDSYGRMAVHDLGAGRVLEVPSDPGTFSPDGSALLTVAQVPGDAIGAKSQVLVTDLATGTSRVAMRPTGRPREALEYVAWAPDGTRIAIQFRSRQDRSTLTPQDRNRRSDIYVRDLGSGVLTLVSPARRRGSCRSAVLPQWSPDGTHLGFLCGSEATLVARAAQP